MSYSCGHMKIPVSAGADKRSDTEADVKYLRHIKARCGCVSADTMKYKSWEVLFDLIWVSAAKVKGGDPSPLFCTGQATPGILCPVLGPPVEERHRYTRENPAKGHEWWKDGKTSPVRDLRQFSLERARLRDLSSLYQCLQEGCTEDSQGLFSDAQWQTGAETETWEAPSEHQEMLFYSGHDWHRFFKKVLKSPIL